MLYHHVAGDEVKAAIGKRQCEKRPFDEAINVAMGRHRIVHADNYSAVIDKPIFQRFHVIFKKTPTASSIQPDCIGTEVLVNQRSGASELAAHFSPLSEISALEYPIYSFLYSIAES